MVNQLQDLNQRCITSKGGIVEALDDELIVVNSKGFVDECHHFEYKKSKSTGYGMGAEEGKHDDRIMAWAIAWYCRPSASVPRDSFGRKILVG